MGCQSVEIEICMRHGLSDDEDMVGFFPGEFELFDCVKSGDLKRFASWEGHCEYAC
jgi:hypothetical protein